MTDLTRNIKRLTAAKVRGKPLVATLSPFEVTLAEFGSRQGYKVPWAAIYELGEKLQARKDGHDTKVAGAISRAKASRSLR